MSTEFTPLDCSILRLCRALEWSHRNALKASLLKEEQVDLGNERRSLEKIKGLHKYGSRVTIKHCKRRFQEWFEIYVDSEEVADAYIDHEAFVGKSWWNIHDCFKKYE